MVRLWWWLVLVVALASVWLAAGEAHADERPPRIGIEITAAGPSCVTAGGLAEQVVERLGYNPFDEAAAVSLLVRIATDDSGVSAWLSWRGADLPGERVLRASTCEQLFRALRAVVVVAAAAPPRPAARAHAVSVPPATGVEMPQLGVTGQVVVAANKSSRRFRPDVRALVGIGASALTPAGAVPELFVGAELSSQARSVGFEFHVAARDQVAVEGGGSVAASVRAFTVTPCQAVVSWLDLCGLISAGWMSGGGYGLVSSRSSRTPHAAVGSRIAAERSIWGRLGVRAHVDAAINLTKTRLFASDEAVWESRRTELALGISIIRHVW